MHLKKHPFLLGVILLLILGLVSAGVWISQRGVLVVIKNTGNQGMTDVQVTLGGKRLSLQDIPAGTSASGRVDPTADSNVAISFTDDAGTQQNVAVDVYVTSGFKGRVEADVKDGQLESVKSDLRIGVY